MNQSRNAQTGMALLLAAVFFLVAPLPFLASPREDGGALSAEVLPYSVLRLGQDLASARLVDVPAELASAAKPRLQIKGVSYEVQIAPNMKRDEIEAVIDAVARQSREGVDRRASVVRFDGWEPWFLPIRIEYRYFFVFSLGIALYAIYLLVRPSRASNP